MKQFRVGSISMGLAFVLLGVVLLFVQVFKLDIGYVLLSWWPIIFILLGIEMLVYLFKKSDTLKFDFLSIIFVGIIGTAGIGMTIVSELGLLDLLKKDLNSIYHVQEVPEYSESLEGINKIVLDKNYYAVNLYASKDSKLEVFGTIEGLWDKDETLITNIDDYIVTKKSGDILFVTLKNIDLVRQFNGGIYTRELTFVLPEHIEVEALGNSTEKFVFNN